ncbi:HdeD family acid-resistance protein [Sphingomonas oleivorans]|nr:HdeD family acid-resistance protein [Sphingomonas oleivorans]
MIRKDKPDGTVRTSGGQPFPTSEPPGRIPAAGSAPDTGPGDRDQGEQQIPDPSLRVFFDPTFIDPVRLNRIVARNWWAVALRGASAIVLGLLAVLWPSITLMTLVMIFAVYCTVDGILSIMLAVRGARRRERWGLLLLNGIVALAAAAVAIFYPLLTMFAFVLILAAWALITGVLTIAAAIRLKQTHGRIWMIAGGAVAILLGLILLLSPPLGLLTITWLIGLQATLAGVMLLGLAYRLRLRSQEQEPPLEAPPSRPATHIL